VTARSASRPDKPEAYPTNFPNVRKQVVAYASGLRRRDAKRATGIQN